MKIKSMIIAGLLPFMAVGMTSCSTFDSGSAKSLVKPAVLVASSQYLRKNPQDIDKIAQLATVLEIAADAVGGTLTKEQFVALVQQVDVDPEWGVLAIYLWDIYAENVKPSEGAAGTAKLLKDIATALRDSLLFVTPQK